MRYLYSPFNQDSFIYYLIGNKSILLILRFIHFKFMNWKNIPYIC